MLRWEDVSDGAEHDHMAEHRLSSQRFSFHWALNKGMHEQNARDVAHEMWRTSDRGQIWWSGFMFGVFWVLRLGFVFNKNTQKKKNKKKRAKRRESKERKRITFQPDERRVTFKEGEEEEGIAVWRKGLRMETHTNGGWMRRRKWIWRLIYDARDKGMERHFGFWQGKET